LQVLFSNNRKGNRPPARSLFKLLLDLMKLISRIPDPQLLSVHRSRLLLLLLVLRARQPRSRKRRRPPNRKRDKM
jgi:hypothetical protein